MFMIKCKRERFAISDPVSGLVFISNLVIFLRIEKNVLLMVKSPLYNASGSAGPVLFF